MARLTKSTFRSPPRVSYEGPFDRTWIVFAALDVPPPTVVVQHAAPGATSLQRFVHGPRRAGSRFVHEVRPPDHPGTVARPRGTAQADRTDDAPTFRVRNRQALPTAA